MVYKVFRRPSIDLDAKRKSWAHRHPHRLKVGDIIADHGEIVDMSVEPVLDGSVQITFKSGDTRYFDNSEVYSFSLGE